MEELPHYFPIYYFQLHFHFPFTFLPAVHQGFDFSHRCRYYRMWNGISWWLWFSFPHASDIEHLLICLLVISISLGKYLFKSFAHILTGLSIMNCKTYIFWISEYPWNFLSAIWSTNIFLHSLGYDAVYSLFSLGRRNGLLLYQSYGKLVNLLKCQR